MQHCFCLSSGAIAILSCYQLISKHKKNKLFGHFPYHMPKKPSIIVLLCITIMKEIGNNVVGRCENAIELKGSVDESLSLPSETKEVSIIYFKDGISLD